MSFVQVPPDSTGKKIYTKQATVGADTVQVQAMHLADSSNPAQLQSVDNRGAASVRFAEGQPIMGGLGALKNTAQRCIGVYESSLDTYASLFTYFTTSGGTITYNSAQSSDILATTTANGSSARATTNRYHYHLPGSSTYALLSVATGDSGKSGNSRCWGMYDANDGVFFELQDTTLNVTVRSSTTGSVVNTRIPQSSWNKDKLDGTGISGLTLDITKLNTYWLDYNWFGASRVRFGVIAPDGTRIVAHEHQTNNTAVLPFMRTGTLPLSYECVNTSVTGSTSELRSVAAAIYTEGTFEDYTFWRYADLVFITTIDTGDDYTLVSLLKAPSTVNSKHNSVVIYPETLNVYSDQPIFVTIYQNVTTSGVGFGTGSGLLEYTNDNTGYSHSGSAQPFKRFFCGTGVTNIDLTQFFELNDEGIMVQADGTPEVWSITASNLNATNANTVIGLGYKELW